MKLLAYWLILELTKGAPLNSEELKFANWLAKYNEVASNSLHLSSVASWNYETDITDAHAKVLEKYSADINTFQIDAADTVKSFDRSKIRNQTYLRLISRLEKVGTRLSYADGETVSQLISYMSGTYSKAVVCIPDQSNRCKYIWTLGNLEGVMAFNRNFETLKWAWQSWRDVSGPPLKSSYDQFVQLSNKGAKADGFADTGDFWRYGYEDPNFNNTIATLWTELLPLYEELHTYVRRKLKNYYRDKFTSSTIPGHILGDMWAQSWIHIYDITAPYPSEPTPDVSNQMASQGYTVAKMFQSADDFFVSLGLKKVSNNFWQKSMLVKPFGRDVVCHASAYDMFDGQDFRIKMCGSVSMDDFITIHHEMGHIQYFMQYANLPVPFRDGANDGFHEAIGDTMALSVGTLTHLRKLGLWHGESTAKQNINFLFRQALQKIAFLPFAYLMDLWRWRVFDGSYKVAEWNSAWWRLVEQFQGVSAPVPRSETDFDPGSKFHIPENTPYLRYFISNVVQFQFYESLCNAAGHKGPLHECDFYGSKAAGNLLGDMMRLGGSKPWPEALEVITGQRQISTASLRRYFQPLIDWLKVENSATHDCYGWNYQWPNGAQLNTPRCSQ